MNYLLLAFGIAFTTFLVADLIITSFGFDTKSPLSSRYRSRIWKILLGLTGRKGGSKFLNYAGPLTIIGWLLGWLLLVWIGNSIIILSDAESVVESGTLYSTGFWPKVYFVGYTLSTLGSGEYIPNGTGWQLFSAFISFSGFMLITIAIAYLLQVISSATNKRTLASQLYCLGNSPLKLLQNLSCENNFDDIDDELKGFTENLHTLAHQHLAYPILHNFHSADTHASLEINLVRLDEALTVFFLSEKCSEELRVNLRPLRNAISYFLDTLNSAFIKKAENEPPLPDFDILKENGFKISAQDFKHEKLIERRKLLAGWLYNQGWQWQAIFEEPCPALDFWDEPRSFTAANRKQKTASN